MNPVITAVGRAPAASVCRVELPIVEVGCRHDDAIEAVGADNPRRPPGPAQKPIWPAQDPVRSGSTLFTAPLGSPAPRLRLLPWAFGLFNSGRLLSYLPMLWVIHAQGDASQHSLFTWLTWTGANVTMAAWVYEHNGRRLDRAVSINAGNAVMCLATVALILAYRL